MVCFISLWLLMGLCSVIVVLFLIYNKQESVSQHYRALCLLTVLGMVSPLILVGVYLVVKFSTVHLGYNK
jgi:hypothetical protein